ncbi:MAG: Shedu immune nuclease family protein [Pyrinomonadaceae bacterium]
MVRLSRSEEASEAEIIANHQTDKLYTHDFGNGRYFQVVHQDKDGFEIKLGAKTMLKGVYIYEKDDLRGLTVIKVVGKEEKQRVDFNDFNLEQLRAFLTFLKNTPLKDIKETKLSLSSGLELNEETTEQIKALLALDGGEKLIRTLVEEGGVTSVDIVNTAYRKRELAIFKRLLDEHEYWKEYAAEKGISDHSEEKVWQCFFSENDWIFGYGLDYRFEGVLQKEFYVSGADADGKESVISDFLLGDNKFTTFVEIKKPSTDLFGPNKNRAKSWSLSGDLINGVSQILEQKASGQLRFETDTYVDGGKKIANKAYDSKVILVIGDWNRVTSSNDRELAIKQKTFELYRRDSRNIKMLTFDELYERAKFIVEHKEVKSDDKPEGGSKVASAEAPAAVAKSPQVMWEDDKIVGRTAIPTADDDVVF